VGAAPPLVFRRWTKVVLASRRPPVGPFWFPIDCSRRQGIAPAFGQLPGSEPAAIDPTAFAHTLLVSTELCQVALPLRDTGFGAFRLGFASMLVKWVMIWMGCPKKLAKSVASGRAGLIVQEVPPVLVGRQVYPCVPKA
jgi:hypothetical protein